ncbi:MAG TPA: lysylphosphatidylglycerol synthase transmembrane domain-containing protein [Candidatus Saccharimonadales bacterium]|nr:lysylphosphatidylglycerol synthase transmembrane domain-containing protein [Candidatus Saccharimonadales bacterium]
MSENPARNKRWKTILNLVTLAALAGLIYAIRHDLGRTLSNLEHVNGWALFLIIPVEALNYHAQARLYQRLFGLVGNKLSYGFLYKTSLELNFVNHVFPSGGVTGISYFGVRMRKGREITGGKATLVQVMKLALQFLSFEILIIIGLFSLASLGRVNNLVILVATAISTLLVVGTLLFAYIVGSQSRIDHFFTSVTRGLNRLIHLVRPRQPETINVEKARGVFQDFHHNYRQLRTRWRELRGPFWYAFLANLTEVLAVYVVYLAFDKFVNFGAVILAYAVANFAGLVSVLPGGIGIYEGLMTATLAATGISPGTSLPVTIMYRVVNTIIQIPPGYFLYNRALNRGEPVPPHD